ncbi:hypothetical protein PG985_014165 [Apiospora marii]|uniref:Mmc1 C-terminal domain-containing protein n=1 Tax=Apiospora marii TaxID=335849 RepID=A0ABR1R5Y7_9PEZI
MPPRLPLQPAKAAKDGASLLSRSAGSESQAVCFFCSLSRRAARPATGPSPARQPRRKPLSSTTARRFQSTATATTAAPPTQFASATSSAPELDPRQELEQVLLDLQKHAANYVNLSRLQLAISGLRQQPGHESIRVAILGLTNGSDASKTAKELLKLLLADPLKTEEEWEQEIDRHNLAQPMIIRVGAEEHQELGTMSLTRGSLLHEVNVSSIALNGHKLELLLMETNPYAAAQDEGLGAFEDAVLVPTVDIPTSNTGRYTPITTPVHKALMVADGIMGAGSVTTLPLLESESIIAAAVNLPNYKPADAAELPFTVVDVGTAGAGLRLIRNDIGNAMQYEHKWYESNVPKLVEWLKQDVISTSDGNAATKQPVRRLIASLLQNASASIQREEAKQLSSRLSSTSKSTVSPSSTAHLQRGLSDWAETAHTELQEQLDLAFSSQRWRKLGWWKLFWRVDDVGMLTTDILSQRFLPGAERNAIFLAGRIEEAGVPTTNFPVTYTSPIASLSSSPEVQPLKPATPVKTTKATSPNIARWPTSIPTARSYLQNETIPALQALAQKLVLQTLSTSGLTTSIGALAYFGTLTTGLYEAGAVAALGIVWSMRRMQQRWEAARDFWEGEVREEGRKAVRGVEVSVAHVLDNDTAARGGNDISRSERDAEAELGRARELVDKATLALEKLK